MRTENSVMSETETGGINPNIYFLLGCPCAGKTTVGKTLAEKYDMYYFGGDSRRFDYYKLAEKGKHPFMTADTSGFWGWTLDEMTAWEKGVISEQTPFILADLNELSKCNASVLFDGMLDLDIVSKIIPGNQMLYLTVERATCEREFFARADHSGMVENIMSTPGIDEVEKRRRITVRGQAAINAFYENAEGFGIKTLMREDTKSAEDMAERAANYFGLTR